MLDTLPPEVAEMSPGPELATILASADRARLCSADAVLLLQARARQVAHDQAQLLADMYEVSCTDWHTPDGVLVRLGQPDEFAVDQISWALTWSLPLAKAHLYLAQDLLHRLPVVFAALSEGRIDLARARVFHEALEQVDDDIATNIVARLIDRAGGWTCRRLRDRLRYHIHKADPAYVARRYREAVTTRRVRAGRSAAGTGYLTGADLPVDRAAAADDYLGRLARAAKAAGDSRTLQQLRADAYLDLLTGISFQTQPHCDSVTADADARASSTGPRAGGGETEPSAGIEPRRSRGAPDRQVPDARLCCTCGGLRPGDRRGVVTLTMTMASLIGLTDDPAMIPGWGPVMADIARQVAHDQIVRPSWQFAVTDPDGRLLHHGYTRRRPTASAVRHTRLRDQTCRAPNCTSPAAVCDTDHRYGYASGGTSDPSNLDTLCRHHHRLKHAKNLTLRDLGDGNYQWQAPNGRCWNVPVDYTDLLTTDEPDPPSKAA